MIKINIQSFDLGKRIDLVVSKHIEEFSRSYIKKLINKGCLKINGIIQEDASYKVCQADEIFLSLPKPEINTFDPYNIHLEILYEDESLLVINKPKGLVTHPAIGNKKNTLVNALVYYYGDELSNIGGKIRPGIVHRLDKNTSGLMVIAKSNDAHIKLASGFNTRTISRVYTAVVWGVPRPKIGVINKPIGKHKSDRKRMSISDSGKLANTSYVVLNSFKNFASLVHCKLGTGRTHQVRVHMESIGCPLIGDSLYGRGRQVPSNVSKLTNRIVNNFSRQALHAHKLSFFHPLKNIKMVFESDLPIDMSCLIDTLKVETLNRKP